MHYLLALLGLILMQPAVAAANLPPQEEQRQAAADPGAVVLAGNSRFTVLTSALVRVEWSPEALFEDRATLTFVNRKLPVPHFTVTNRREWLVIETDDLRIQYREDGFPLSSENLRIDLKKRVGGKRVTWTPGKEDTGNLGGTTRTLDGVSGATELDKGLLSKDGWVLVDDSDRVLFVEDGWAAERENEGATDWYFFGHGRDYKRALEDYTQVAGRIPLPPRYVFGSWWSRYWPYSDKELKDLVAEFREHDVPLDVLVIDMDWHKEGWTGYSWEPKYFPEPDKFLKWVREQGLRTTLNLHPADGVGDHEDAFPQMAKALGLDPEKTERIPFDGASREFMDAYFRYLHHPLERQGVDFWWMDWQQEKTTKIAGLDPLFWLNHLHWLDMERNREREGKRPMIFSRWGGLGNHRYQIGFSGDTYCNWESLAFQPHFTATAGNVGYGYWSHDIGGHQPGKVAPELYARWIQWGALNPILRTHATANELAERRIWMFPPEVFEAAREAFHLRYALIPYIYTAARQTYDTGLSLCRPLYYEWPDLEEAYNHPGQYLFGKDLLVAPVVTPMNEASRTAQVNVWLPPGEWTNWFTGQSWRGPQTVSLAVPLSEIPLFVRGGAIIPMAPKMRSSDEAPLDHVVLHVWPGKFGEGFLYEDSGTGSGYRKEQWGRTKFIQGSYEGRRTITILPVAGRFPGQLTERSYQIRLRDTWPTHEFVVNGNLLAESAFHYDPATLTLVIDLPKNSVFTKQVIDILPMHRNERPLRAGLRGEMNLLQAIAKDLGAATPKEVLALLAARDALATKKHDVKAAAAALKNRAEIIAAVAAAEGHEEATLQALTRLVGFSYSMSAQAQKDGNVKLMAMASVQDRKGQNHDLEISLKQTAGWLSEESGSKKGLERAWLLRPENGLRAARVAAEVNFKQGARRFAIPMETWMLPSINAWSVVGPFHAPWEEQLSIVAPPENEIDLAASYEGKNGLLVSWQKVQRELTPGHALNEEFFIDLVEMLGEHEFAFAYGATWFDVEEPQEAVLSIGSDDGIVAWLNGKEVHRHVTGRPYTPKQDVVRVMLQKGENELLLKIGQGSAGWAFGAHLENLEGEPLQIQYRTTPQEKVVAAKPK